MKRISFSFFSWQNLAGNRRLFLLCFVLFVASASLSFTIFFPADVLQQRLLQEVSDRTGLKLYGRDATMVFPPGLRMDLTIFHDIPELAEIELTGLQISPLWSSLLSGSPAVDLSGELAGGHIDLDAGQDGHVNLALEGVTLGPLQRTDLPYHIDGELSGTLDCQNLSAEMTGRGVFSFYLKNSQVRGAALMLLGLPESVSAGELHLTGKFDQRRISLEQVLLVGGDLELSGGGNILIGETAEQTRLNLNIRLHPTSTTPDNFREFLKITGLRPTVDGSYLLRIGGTLAKPSIR
jgi:type II secretion system protein N